MPRGLNINCDDQGPPRFRARTFHPSLRHGNGITAEAEYNHARWVEQHRHILKAQTSEPCQTYQKDSFPFPLYTLRISDQTKLRKTMMQKQSNSVLTTKQTVSLPFHQFKRLQLDEDLDKNSDCVIRMTPRAQSSCHPDEEITQGGCSFSYCAKIPNSFCSKEEDEIDGSMAVLFWDSVYAG